MASRQVRSVSAGSERDRAERLWTFEDRVEEAERYVNTVAEQLLNDVIFAWKLPRHRNSPASFYGIAINCGQLQSSGFMRRADNTNQSRATAFIALLNALLNREVEDEQ